LIRIASRANPQYKALRLLAQSARERREQQRTLLDGPHLVRSYLDHGAMPALVAVDEEACTKPEIHALLERARASAAICLPPDLFSQLAPVASPVGILAVIDIPRPTPEASLGDFVVMLESVQDPGNVGTIIRSAAGAGVRDVLLSCGCADAWSPRCLRAAMGAHFAVAVHANADLQSAVGGFGGNVVATAGRNGMAPHRLDLRGPLALLFGAEGTGLSAQLMQAAKACVSIPLAPGIESLNVAAAAAVVLFERVRQLDSASFVPV
jgi:TrmH family RNA methyltransferase